MELKVVPIDLLGLEIGSGAACALYRIAERSKVEAIAMVRWKSGMGLVEAKNWLEKFMDHYEEATAKREAAQSAD
jgi:ribosomal protein L7/L12